jgi:hypothetical protein
MVIHLRPRPPRPRVAALTAGQHLCRGHLWLPQMVHACRGIRDLLTHARDACLKSWELNKAPRMSYGTAAAAMLPCCVLQHEE